MLTVDMLTSKHLESGLEMRAYLKMHKDGDEKFGHRKEPGVDFDRVAGMVQRDMVRLYRLGNNSLNCYGELLNCCGERCQGVDAPLNAKEKKNGDVYWRRWTLNRIANTGIPFNL
jgi:hypothetical protein